MIEVKIQLEVPKVLFSLSYSLEFEEKVERKREEAQRDIPIETKPHKECVGKVARAICAVRKQIKAREEFILLLIYDIVLFRCSWNFSS